MRGYTPKRHPHPSTPREKTVGTDKQGYSHKTAKWVQANITNSGDWGNQTTKFIPKARRGRS